MYVTLFLPFSDAAYAINIGAALNAVAPQSVKGFSSTDDSQSSIELELDGSGLTCVEHCLEAISQDEGVGFRLECH